MPKITAIFFYGTLKDSQIPNTTVFKDVIVRGFRIHRGASFPVAVKGSREDKVVGNLFDFHDDEDLQRRLEQWDHYEGCDKNDAKSLYHRRTVSVEIFPGRQAKRAWMYIDNPRAEDDALIDTPVEEDGIWKEGDADV